LISLLPQYRRFHPAPQLIEENPAKARLRFALDAIRSEVHEKNRKWSWGFFAERRDDRKAYVELFSKMKKATGGALTGSVSSFPSLPSLNPSFPGSTDVP